MKPLVAVLALSIAPPMVFANAKSQAYSALKGKTQTRLLVIDDNIRLASLSTSHKLGWTRELLARPDAKWGSAGLDLVFKEKFSALASLEFASRQVASVRRETAAFRSTYGASIWRQAAFARTEWELHSKEAAIGRAREELKATAAVWLSHPFRLGLAPAQRVLFEAIVRDGHDDQALIRAAIDKYIDTNYSPSFF